MSEREIPRGPDPGPPLCRADNRSDGLRTSAGAGCRPSAGLVRSVGALRPATTCDPGGVRAGPPPGVGVVRVASQAGIGGREPNPLGHRALAELEGRVPDFTLITQNVDGLHRRAGSENVMSHGEHPPLEVLLGGRNRRAGGGERVPPVCPNCGELRLGPT